MQRDISLRRPGAQRGFSSLYSLTRQFTRFPKMANRVPLFLDCSYRGNSLHNAYQSNTGEMERKEEGQREKEREREREREREKERERAQRTRYKGTPRCIRVQFKFSD